MTPALSITDEALDQLIETARPQIRAAFKETIANESVSMFEVMKLPLPSGQQWSVAVFVMVEPYAILTAALIGNGVPGYQQSLVKRNAAPQPTEDLLGGFGR